jgi:DNA-binding transcriptional LysR family regulator
MTKTSWRPDLLSLRLFVAVCEETTIARAAEREAIAPSAISKRIAEIEDLAGVKLLERGARGVTPTPAGEALLHHARQVLRGIAKMQTELSEYAQGVRGHVRVYANVSSIVEFLPNDLGTFLAKHPHVRLDLQERVSTAVVAGVRESTADIGICWSVVDTTGLQVYPYETDQLMVVVHPAHPLARLKSMRLEDTLDYEFVGLQPESIMNVFLSGIAVRLGKALTYRINVTTFDAACRVIAANLAIGVIPSQIARGYEVSLGLKAVPLTEDWAHRQIIQCVRDYEALPVPARAFVDHLRERSEARKGKPRRA